MIDIHVPLTGGRSYPVVVGPGAIKHLQTVLPPVSRVAVVTQDGIEVEVDPGVEQRVFTIPDGEQAKTLMAVSAERAGRNRAEGSS